MTAGHVGERVIGPSSAWATHWLSAMSARWPAPITVNGRITVTSPPLAARRWHSCSTATFEAA